jgi:hypothetical protein
MLLDQPIIAGSASALVDIATSQSAAPSIGISLDPEWVPARLTPVGRATCNRGQRVR